MGASITYFLWQNTLILSLVCKWKVLSQQSALHVAQSSATLCRRMMHSSLLSTPFNCRKARVFRRKIQMFWRLWKLCPKRDLKDLNLFIWSKRRMRDYKYEPLHKEKKVDNKKSCRERHHITQEIRDKYLTERIVNQYNKPLVDCLLEYIFKLK